MQSVVRIQRNIVFLAILLFCIKLLAWFWTKSVAVFTDAMESTVNVASGFIGWYSVWLASKPKDRNHPYGHGKVEFISSAIEGTLITLAALAIIYKGVYQFIRPAPLQQIDRGWILLGITAVINYLAGTYALRKGTKERSQTLQAAGSHLRTDTYSTAGIIIALLCIKVTGWLWLDPVVAILVALIILYTGYKVIRKSLAGIMDEADMALLNNLIQYLQKQRQPCWIDLHNLRMIQYGSTLHLDGHLTLPWYYNVKEAHREIDRLDNLIRSEFGSAVELFVHVDGCEDFSCSICSLQGCPVRRHPLKQTIKWELSNVLQNSKHNSPGQS